MAIASSERAAAFDFFGLFGDDTPKPSATTLPYKVEFDIKGDDGIESSLQDASSLYRLRDAPPPDGISLVQRVQADFAPLIDALWGEGYYNARVTISVADVPLQLGRDHEGAAARAADAYRNRDAVPIKVTAETGPQFKLRTITVVQRGTRQALSEAELPAYVTRLKPGDPARAADLRAADARLIDYFRSQAHPLAKAPLPEPVVDHAAESMDVTYNVDPGPRAGFGEVTIGGPKTFDPSIVRSFIYLEQGEPYSPEALDKTRRSVATIPAVGSVRIREADHLDPYGNLPIFVDVTDRAPNLVGFSAGYSTLDGPNGRVYYENRNLFGGAERLRLEGSAFLAPRNNGTRIREIGDFKWSDLGARFRLGFLKPAIDGTRWDFLFDGIAERNRTGGGRFGGYTDRLAGGTAALRYRVDGDLALEAGLKYERGQTSDPISKVDYQLVGVPLTIRYDNTDKPLDPTRGIRVAATLTPYADAFGNSNGFARADLRASGYYAFDPEARFTLAARAGFSSVFDGPNQLADLPSNYRTYVGGLETIRGYRFQSIGPSAFWGLTVGGRSAFNATVEGRIKVTDNIGIAPFVDVGGAYRGSLPILERVPGRPDHEQGDTRASAGAGLIYYSGIGPIRLDLAAPLNPRKGDRPLALYVSIGQSF